MVKDKQTDQTIDRCTDKWIDEWMETTLQRCINRWTGGWMKRKIVEWMDECIHGTREHQWMLDKECIQY